LLTSLSLACFQVDDPEDHLQVNKYMELTQKTKPVILISLHEISATHHLVLQNLDALAEKDDELRVIMKDLGDAPPEIPEEDDREIQLTLTSNRFKVSLSFTCLVSAATLLLNFLHLSGRSRGGQRSGAPLR
jgi:hypothetical protein